jgi:hypothetical protein
MSVRDLADVIDSLHRERQTGVLSVSVRSDNNQLKLFFRSGTIYFVTYSTCRNLECLIRLGSLAADRGFFLPGAKVDAPQPITLSMPDIIERVRSLKKMIEWGPAAASSGAAPADAADQTMVSGDQVAGLEDELLSLIGPVGAIIFEQALQARGVSRGAALPKRAFQDLVHAISQQVPEGPRKLLLAKHAF